MKFTNKVKITIAFGKKYTGHVIFYAKGDTEVRGDEKRFIITGEFANQENKYGKDASRDIK
jgi:hypothetical protein